MEIYKNLDINDLDGEIWKDILDHEDDYQVSNIGRVKSFKHNKINGKILKQIKDKDDYFQVVLWKNKKPETKKVHRLIYEAFKEKLEEGYDVHHINGDEKYNFIENLESKPHDEHTSFHMKGKNHPLFGKHLSVETRKKISKKHKGKHLSEKTKQKISENHVGMVGKHHSDETLKKMSNSMKEKFKNGELNLKGENNPLFGKHHSDETLKKMSDLRRGKNNPNFKMTNQKIIDIQIDLEKENLSQKHIAKKHNISQSTVSLIKREKIRIT